MAAPIRMFSSLKPSRHCVSVHKCLRAAFNPRFCILRLIVRNITEGVSSQVRVRFAPSPTGYLHLGGLRTALYNFLFARSNNGRFILRIEDTDQARAVPGAIEKLQDTLQWAGISPDEGPGFGGNHGPYIQSERLHLYQHHIQTLLNNGWAYPCFCTARRLELMRKEAVRQGETSKYDNRCRSLSQDEIDKLKARGTPFVVRLKLEPTPDPWDDMVKGETSHNIFDIEGDPVLMKSDGYPTYHFANVVDDHLMQVSHVLRGSEWLASTPKHILLYKAFGWTPPRFGHLPLIVNPDGSKLSKRQGDIHVEHFRELGYFPQAVLNYITSIGGGFSRYTVDMTLKDMCESFDVSSIRSNAGRLSPVWLSEANRNIVREMVSSDDPQVQANLAELVRQLVVSNYNDRLEEGALRDQILSDGYILNIIKWSLLDDRTSVLTDFVKPELEYLWVAPSHSNLSQLTSIEAKAEMLLTDLLAWASKEEDYSVDHVAEELRGFAKSYGLPAKKFFTFMRMAFTGLKQGPPLAEMMSVIGKENVIVRLETSLKTLRQS